MHTAAVAEFGLFVRMHASMLMYRIGIGHGVCVCHVIGVAGICAYDADAITAMH